MIREIPSPAGTWSTEVIWDGSERAIWLIDLQQKLWKLDEYGNVLLDPSVHQAYPVYDGPSDAVVWNEYLVLTKPEWNKVEFRNKATLELVHSIELEAPLRIAATHGAFAIHCYSYPDTVIRWLAPR